MVKQAVARATDLEPIDRLEDKIKRLIDLVNRLKADQVAAEEEHNRLTQQVDDLRRQLVDAEGSSSELEALRDERDVIRTRVAEMLQQLDTI
ncbi:MAG: cell division protein ZapB [Acidobacteria bacterium]|nr:cell division protein ZapB [Acidobacteriota bacterium]